MTRLRFAHLAALLASLLWLSTAAAGIFKSIGAAPAILYDAPSTRGGKLYVAPRGMPVEVMLSYGNWVKLRDMNGDVAWAEAAALSPRRMLVVRSANAKLRAAADDNASVLMSADRGVLLELLGAGEGMAAAPGWLKVHHRDGATGFVKTTDVWGF